MRGRLQVPIRKALQLRAEARAGAERRLEHRWEHYRLLRDLADLAYRTIRRRRQGDGRPDPS